MRSPSIPSDPFPASHTRARARDEQRYVNIREYYEKDGAQLPTKKGISLTPEQFEVLKQHIGAVSAELAKHDGA